MLHHALAVFLAVAGSAPAVLGDQHLIQIQLERGDIQIVHARIADRGEDAAQVGIGREERGLDQRRVRDRVADLLALGLALAALDAAR